MSVPYFLESLLLPTQNERNLLGRQDEWIRQCIQLFSNDETKMYCLFSVISKLEIERKKEYILLFLENNSLFEDFQRIPLTPTSWSWSGSKKYIETQIGYLKERIESEQIDEILRG